MCELSGEAVGHATPAGHGHGGHGHGVITAEAIMVEAITVASAGAPLSTPYPLARTEMGSRVEGH